MRKNDDKKVITPHLFVEYSLCPAWIWHDLFTNKSLKGDIPELALKLMEKGVIHEKDYIKDLTFDEVSEIDPKAAFAHTLELMRQGAELIYQGEIETEIDGIIWRGRPDLLQKIPLQVGPPVRRTSGSGEDPSLWDGPPVRRTSRFGESPTGLEAGSETGESKFGNWFYIPIDIKSSNDINPDHKYQLAFYAKVLAKLQNKLPHQVAIINKEKKRQVIPVDSELMEKMHARANQILSIIRGQKPTLHYKGGCKQSPWGHMCLEDCKKVNDAALIYNIRETTLNKLREAGFETVADLAELNPREPQFKISANTWSRIILQAQSLIKDDIIWTQSPDIPTNGYPIYFDIEGDPLLGVDYLFGFWLGNEEISARHSDSTVCHPERSRRISKLVPVDSSIPPPVGGSTQNDNKNQEGKFVYFLAPQPEDERKMWLDFLAWLPTLPKEYIVYHYAPYEKIHLDLLEKKYGGSPELNIFKSKLVDLFTVVKNSVIFPLYFYSVKDLAKSRFVNYKWRHQKASGAQSIFWYEKWLETGDKQVLQDIIDYNEDDVIATEHLLNWLKTKS